MNNKLQTSDDVMVEMLNKIGKSGLTEKHATRLGFDTYTAQESLTSNLPFPKAGFKIPYYDLAGNETKFWRFRYLESTLNAWDKASGKKEMRYCQPKGSLNELYLPPLVDWAKIAGDTTVAVIITEGELKAACACAAGFPTIGLGGVWCFRSAANHMHLLPMFDEFKWEQRTVFICYDSDAAVNTKVMAAENTLARELTLLGAVPFIVRLPQTSPPLKTGLDDYLVEEGVGALKAALQEGVEWRAAKELFKLNEEVVYVRDPGVILRLDNMQKMTPMSFTNHAYANRRYFEEVIGAKGVKLVERSAPVEWMKWPLRAEVARCVYKPGEDHFYKGAMNTWPGWGCYPAEGSVQPWEELMAYMFNVEDIPERAKDRVWFEQWLAYPLQHPGEKLYTAAVFWGTRHGTGKSLIGYSMIKIYGKNGTEIGDRDLHSSFNECMENKQFIMGEEITGGDKRAVADHMKSMITQKQIRLNVKYIPSYTIDDCINYYFTSNHPDAFFLEDTDRRFFIHEINAPPKPFKFYTDYMTWLNGSGANALFDYLLKIDCTGFNPQGAAPMTVSKQEMIDNGKSDIAAWVALLKDQPDYVTRLGGVTLKYRLWSATELHSIYDKDGRGKTTIGGMARELARAGIEKAAEGANIFTDHGMQKLWIIRPIPHTVSPAELSEMYLTERGIACKKTTTKF
jgi:hypothetical protein